MAAFKIDSTGQLFASLHLFFFFSDTETNFLFRDNIRRSSFTFNAVAHINKWV